MITRFFGQAHWLLVFTSIALFLFPVLGNTVKSWTGFFFLLLVILGLALYSRNKLLIDDWDRKTFLLCALTFFVVFLSCVINGWGEEQTKGLGVFIRVLLFIPVYLAVRHLGGQVLLTFGFGCALGAFLLVLQGFYDIFWARLDRAYGIYESPGLVAGQAVVFAIVCYYASQMASVRGQKVLLRAGFLFAILAVVLSGSRSTQFALVLALSAFAGVCIWQRTYRKFLGHFLMVVVVLLASFFINGLESGVSELVEYINQGNSASGSGLYSVGTRLELWHASLILIGDNPIWGVGWRNFPSETSILVQSGQADPAVLGHRHPHNAYLEAWVSNGLLGFAALMGFGWITLRQIVVFDDATNKASRSALLSFFVFLACAAVNEGGLFIYGNSLSFYLLVYAVLLASLRGSTDSRQP